MNESAINKQPIVFAITHESGWNLSNKYMVYRRTRQIAPV